MSPAPNLVPVAAVAPAPQPPAAALPVQRRIDLVMVHCSATPSGRWLCGRRGEVGFVPAVQIIDRWHQARGFARTAASRQAARPELAAVGYHYVIDLDGYIDPGRALVEVGAHVAGFNAASVGICLVGGAERDARYTQPQWDSLARLVATVCRQKSVPLQAPLYPRRGGGVCGHRDLSPDINANGEIEPTEWLKTCPGFDVSAWIGRGCKPAPQQVCGEVRP